MNVRLYLAMSALIPALPARASAEYMAYYADDTTDILCAAVLGGFIVAFMICMKFKNAMNTARFARNAHEYLQQDTVAITKRREQFVHTSVMRQPLPRQQRMMR